MDYETTRRALLGLAAAGGAAATVTGPVASLVEQFAPLSGSAWDAAGRAPAGTVESPHGPAEVRYDDHHVPHVSADSEAAAYFAVGYVQGFDRLFQMDLVRRLMDGRLSAVVGEATVDSDVFHAKMDFRGGADASVAALSDTRTERLAEAYADGVNAAIEGEELPLEFRLLGYEPEPWSVADTLLVGMQISWGLTGSFNTLRRAVLREQLGEETYRRLYGRPFDHGAPIVREGRTGGEVHGTGEREGADEDALRNVDADFVDWLARHEPPPLLGSNSWVVSGEFTDSGSPIVCNDPHLTLMAPPVWYEQHIDAGDVNVRGVSFPGVPFVIIGENDHGAWGFTNTGADVVDFYTYETRERSDGPDQYRYDGEWRDFDVETRTVEVSGGDDREVEVKKTVHGAFVDREVNGRTRHVGVSWTGMTGTRESEAVYEFSRAEGIDDFTAAIEKFDVPTQNAVYADRDGNTLYYVTGKIPVRQVDGQVVRGDRVFDGSAGEAEWAGFTPFGQSSWEGFVPFEDKPGVVNPDYVGTANQRLVDDPTYPIGQEYASGFRGMRIYERLDGAVEAGEAITPDLLADLQADTLDVRARMLVPAILEARDRMPDAADRWLDAMADWDFRMDRDSGAALAFRWFYEYFREETWADDYEAAGLDDGWWPQEWVLTTLPADDEHFGGDRAAVMATAMERAVQRIDEEGWETYGDFNRTALDHQFGSQVPALNYPRYPTDGSSYTVSNFRHTSSVGSSWRMVAPMDGDSRGVLPGGNSGDYFSEHYSDQLRTWADHDYKSMAREAAGDLAITFESGGDGG